MARYTTEDGICAGSGSDPEHPYEGAMNVDPRSPEWVSYPSGGDKPAMRATYKRVCPDHYIVAVKAVATLKKAIAAAAEA